MRILTVIPIGRGMSKDTLTYFTSSDAPVGAIVSIPLRKKTAYGLVTASVDAKDMKSELKSLSYSMRKVEKIETRGFLSDSFIKSAESIADHNATSVGAVLSALIPSSILEGSKNLTYVQKEKLKGVFYETTILQSDDTERYATYRALVREEFAKNHSIFFCLPGVEDILNAKTTLEKGIEKYTYVLHSGLSKKEIVSIWQKVTTETHPVLIIATGSFLSLPRGDISTIIVEKESSRGFKMQSRPFLDIRMVAEIVAKETGIRLVLGDTLLRVETLWKEKNPIENTSYRELSPLKWRSLSTSTYVIDNIKAPADMKKKEFVIIGEKLKKVLEKSVENNEHTFLFCGRKGLYPMTVCSDCGTIVVCKNCNAPVVLYGKQGANTKNSSNLFVCHHCGERRDAHELCLHCGGWRLLPLGIGTERVYEDLKKLFPKTLVIIMDKDHVATQKQAVKLRELFYNTPGSIMVGTEIAIPYLNQKIENTGVISIDSFFSIPDFQINEKIFHVLLALRDISTTNMIVQTRKENVKLFDYALHGNLIDFFRDEIEERKSIGYPPFVTYIKLTLEGEKTAVKKHMEQAGEMLKPFELSVFDAFNPGSKSKFVMHGLISLPKGEWVKPELLAKLRSLPPSFSIKIDPDTLL